MDLLRNNKDIDGIYSVIEASQILAFWNHPWAERTQTCDFMKEQPLED